MPETLRANSSRTLAQAPVFFESHTPEDRAAIMSVFATLERAVNSSDGDLFDSVLGEDVIWGTPKGQVVHGLNELNPIHRRLAVSSHNYGHSSRFTLEALGFIAPNLACASVRRSGLDENGLLIPPSRDAIVQEMALYVLVKRTGKWWIVSAQNTPVWPL